jgi:methionine synthase I (cobalamin-dependent)
MNVEQVWLDDNNIDRKMVELGINCDFGAYQTLIEDLKRIKALNKPICRTISNTVNN